MAYSTPNATYGAKDTKKVAKQTAPKVSTPNATYGATDTKHVDRQTSTAAPATPASSPSQSGGTRSGRSSQRNASPRKSRSRPEPALTKYKAPPVVSKAVKTELRQIKDNQAKRAARKPIEIAPKLKAPVRVTRKSTVVSPRAAKQAVRDHLPPKQAKQAAQKIRRVSPAQRARHSFKRVNEDPEIKGRKERLVAKRLEKAAKRTQGGLARKLNRAYGPNETIKPRYAAIVAESEGLPGKTYRQIAKGESAFKPGVPNPDDGYPSLWQMTPSVQSPETVAKWDKIASKYPGGSTNPIVAAKQAVVLAGGKKAVKAGATGTSNYFGTSFMTDENAHLPGGQAAARRKLYGNPEPIPKSLRTKAKAVLGKQATKKVIKQAKHPTTASASTKPPPAKELHKWVVLTESKAEQGAEQGVKPKRAYKVTVRNMSPELQNALVRLGKNTGIPVRVNEGYRTTKRAEEFDSGTGSQHHLGNAVDVDNNADYTAADLAAAGLNNTAVPGEPWHFQPNETGSSVATISGSGGSTTGSVAQTFQAAVSGSQGASSTTSKRGKHKKRKVKRRPAAISLAGIPADLDPADYEIRPSTQRYSDYVKSQRVSVGL